MPLISVITPAYRPTADQLTAAYESLAAQDLPPGWEVEWLVQEDGREGATRAILPDDPRINHGDNRHLGPAMTRNLALARARGDLVKNFDADDLLQPGVLVRDIDCLTQHTDVHWSTSRVLDLLPNGTLEGFANDPEPGRIEPGAAVEHWRAHNYRLPVHPTTLCIRRNLAIALGGWMAVPGSEDSGLLVSAATIAAGWFHAEVGLHYRKHADQQTAASAHTDENEWRARMALISERSDALAQEIYPQVNLQRTDVAQ